MLKHQKNTQRPLSAWLRRHRHLAYSAVLLLLSLIIVVTGNFLSGAWLYHSDKIEVQYTVAKLSFDLSSNHMYCYYSRNPDYVDDTGKTEAERERLFENVLTQLAALQSEFDRSLITLQAYETSALTILKQTYPADFIDRLYALEQDAATYEDGAVKLYKEYSPRIEFPFKITGVDFDFVEAGKSLLYEQVKDLLSMYGGEYVVQKDADGVSTSTMTIGVKLKGGTTYQSYIKDNDGNYTVEAPYQDVNFNEMVMPLTMQFKNTGNANLFLYLQTVFENNDDEGVLGFLMPMGFRVKEATAYVKDGAMDYRAMLVAVFKEATAQGLIPNHGYTDADWQNLSYAQLKAVQKEWDAYAVGTYRDSANADTGNLSVTTPVDGAATDTVMMDMLFWADYEQNAAHYQTVQNNTQAVWDTDTAYTLIQYDFTVKVRTSLKDIVMVKDDDVDYSLVYNKKQDYLKFAGISNFDVEGYAYFQDGANEINAKAHMSGGYIIANYTNPEEPNYIGKLRFTVRYRGFSPAYIRVRVIEQWTNGQGQIVGVTQIPFAKAANWVDNRANDMYFYSSKLYYSTDKDVLTTTGKAKLMTVPVLTGIGVDDVRTIDKTLQDDNSLTLKLSILVEAVQPNRFEEFWGIETIPTTDADVG